MTLENTNEAYKMEMMENAAKFYQLQVNKYTRFEEDEIKQGSSDVARYYSGISIEKQAVVRYCEGKERGKIEGLRFTEDWLDVRFDTWETIKTAKETDKDSESYKIAFFLYNKVKEEHQSPREELYYQAYVVNRAIEKFYDEAGDLLDKLHL